MIRRVPPSSSVPARPHRTAAVTVLAAGVTLVLAVPAGGRAQEAGGASERAEPQAITLVDLLELPALEDPRLGPDGRSVLFIREDADWEENERIQHIWRAAVDGDSAVQLTTGEDGETSPRWSPGGRWVAFLAERGDQERPQIHLLPLTDGEARPLTEHPTAPSEIEWSPDARWIYFLAENEKTDEEKAREEAKNDVRAYDEGWRHRHLWRVAVDDGSTERLTEGDFSVRDYDLSRDGNALVLHRGPTPLFQDLDATEVWAMGAGPDGEMRRVTRNDVFERGARLSPDNDRVLFTAMANADFEFYYQPNLFVAPIPTASGDTVESRLLMADREEAVGSAAWTPDGTGIWFLANTGVRQDLFRVRAADGAVDRITEGDHTVGDWHYRPELNRHVFRIATHRNAGDVHLLDTSGTNRPAPRRVTGVYDGLSDEYRLPRQEAITWTGEDGVTVEGLLFYPLDYRQGRRYPLVVQTHGGPTASDKFGFGSRADYPQVLTAMGYFVLKPNYRGSTGYGDAFMRDMVGHYFHQAHRDVMAGVDALVERGLADEDRMAKMGWSAGGHMTNKIITYTDRFAAASSGAGASNWVSMYGQSDIRFYRTPWFGASPWDADTSVDTYWAHSPLSDVHEVSTPTLFLVGENDERVPMPQSVEMYRALRHHGVAAHLYVAPRESHGWEELRHQLFKANVELDWFERRVRDRDYRWETAPEDDEEESIQSAEQVHR